MTRKQTIFLLVMLILVAIVIGYFLFSNLKKNSGIRIETYPKSTVFLDGKKLGETPFYREGLESKEYSVKLVPQSGNFAAYEMKVSLNAQTLTVLTRVFNINQDLVSGEIITLEKSGVDLASMSVVSDPDAVIVKVDGEDKGLSPISLKDLPEGSREIIVSKPGYDTQTVNGTLVKGYDLHLVVKLPRSIDSGARSASTSAVSNSIASSSAVQVNRILILPTPTGFLRVRSIPSGEASESGKVLPGEKYDLLGEQSGWVEIKTASGSGWVSSTYTQKTTN